LSVIFRCGKLDLMYKAKTRIVSTKVAITILPNTKTFALNKT